MLKSTTCLDRNGYHLLCSDRPEMKQGGGIGLMFRSDLKVKTLDEGCRNTFEYSVWQIRLKDKDQRDQTFEILVVYHPPPSENNKHMVQSFIDDFLELYIELGTTCTNLIIMGDFNIHVDDLNNLDPKQFNKVCMGIGLEQVVNFGTHVQGHTLDLVLHESNSSIKIKKIQPEMYLLDHCFVEMEINIERLHVVFKKSTYRNWKKADMEKVYAQLADLDKNSTMTLST